LRPLPRPHQVGGRNHWGGWGRGWSDWNYGPSYYVDRRPEVVVATASAPATDLTDKDKLAIGLGVNAAEILDASRHVELRDGPAMVAWW